jgi:asparagine synthase (glutamine-hydrolysing)
MCGFMGAIGSPFDIEKLTVIHHRGPDSQGLWLDEDVCLGHVRLSIQDLSSAGHQPMVSECGKYVLIFNGEIYNHLNLRKRINFDKFKGHSDTETLLYYLIENGVNNLSDLNGIFCFAFYDITQSKLHLARDKFGVKPLYYTENEGAILFASEIRALTELGIKSKVDSEKLSEWFKFRYIQSPDTLLENVHKLAAGEIRTYNTEFKKLESTLRFDQKLKIKNITEKAALDKYDELLRAAVERQLLSDVPIAILLSGGVDSALLAKLVIEQTGKPLNAFTAGYSIKSDANEIDEARRSAELLGCDLTEVILEADDFFGLLPELITMVEEPLGSQSIYPINFLAQAIKAQGYKVALTGQGVDEPWGGYGRYKYQNYIESLNPITSILPSQLSRLIKNEKIRRATNGLLKRGRAASFVESYSMFDDHMLSQLFSAKVPLTKLDNQLHNELQRLDLSGTCAADAMMALDARNNLSDDLLLYTDKISMQHSLEFRVPYLDVELMDFVESLPVKYRVGKDGHKILHKKYSESILPKEIIYRPKKGFFTPRKEWFKSSRGKMEFEIIASDKGLFGSLFNGEYISALYKSHSAGKVNYEKQLYMILVFYYWLKQHE